jgi:Domain of unknown function (DUF1906)
MRRAIVAAVMGGLVLGGAVATPSFAAARSADKVPGKALSRAQPAQKKPAQKKPATSKAAPKKAAATASAMKTVVYEGYEFQVPARWPVYRLDEHPRTCVRYDVHAVYLGTPGPDMQCAAGLIGRTQTVSFLPGAGTAAGPRAGSQPQQAGGVDLQRLTAVHGVITQNAVQHQLSVSLSAANPGAKVLGTYGAEPGVIQQVLGSLHLAPAHAVQTPQSGSVPEQPGKQPDSQPSKQPGVPPAKPAPPKNVTYTSWRGVPAHWPVEIVQPPQPPQPPKPVTPTPLHPVGGFDTCTAPSVATMRAWRSDYSAVGVYIGGTNSACAYGNLSASWVRSVTSQGWGLLPTYVGPQSPCWDAGPGVLIKPASAAAEGAATAADSIKEARGLGLAAGSPIYYDMEAYNGGSSCTNAVLQFLSAWDRQVTAAGYVPGVYSSQDSGISDMQTAAAERTLGFIAPDAIWIALWDNNPTLSDGTLAWPLCDRSKQYSGNVNETISGITLNIDKDIVGGLVAH